ncbi:MAG: AI-2E family transporter [Caldilineaceae bacterium]|nr:AI-2E family transporter [Caldilineaceae bacterium]
MIDDRGPEASASPPVLPAHWDTPLKRGILILILILAIFLLWLARPVLPLVILAGILSYLLAPVANIISRPRLPRGLMTFLLYLLLLTALVLGLYAMLPVLDTQYQTVLRIGGGFVSGLLVQVSQIPDTVHLLDMPLETAPLKQVLEPWLGETTVDGLPTLQGVLNRINDAYTATSGVFRGTLNFGLGIINTGVEVLLSALFVFVVSFYLTKDAPHIRAFLEGNFPRKYKSEWQDLIRCVGNVWRAFFFGQIILSFTIGVAVYVLLRLLGVQGALVLALIAGLLEVIPNLGPIISLVPTLLVALTTGSSTFPEMNFVVFSLILAASYFVLQQIENTIVVPRLIGRFVQIHPTLVIIGVTVGYLSNGVVGAFLAAPLMGSARVLGTYIFAKLMDYPVSFPETESNHPFRRTEISIQVHKDGPETDGLESDPAAGDSKEPQPSKRPQETAVGDLPASDSMLDTPAPSA